ncbi:MAG: ATP synthase F1 subunit epsilon [Butyrivibrio sp.]|nr:ATP synthase F1 subunit epsilon [Butyrivibrio sp.]
MQESNVDAHLFHLKVVSVNGVFYDGKCRAVVLPSIDGEMAFLAHHEEMFLAIYDGQIRIQKEDGSWIEAIVSLGSAQYANNRCTIFVDTCELPEEIDKRRATEALELAQEHLRQEQSIREHQMSQAAMARALTRLKYSTSKNINLD